MSYIAGIPYHRRLLQQRKYRTLFCRTSGTHTYLRPFPHHPFHPCMYQSLDSTKEPRNLRM